MSDDAVKEEPRPVANAHPASWDLVLRDLQNPRLSELTTGFDDVLELFAQDALARDHLGQERYGTRLQPHNGRDALVDAYQEACDAVVYLRSACYERRHGHAWLLYVQAVRLALALKRVLIEVHNEGGKT